MVWMFGYFHLWQVLDSNGRKLGDLVFVTEGVQLEKQDRRLAVPLLNDVGFW